MIRCLALVSALTRRHERKNAKGKERMGSCQPEEQTVEEEAEEEVNGEGCA